MMVVIIQFALRAGAEETFQSVLKDMQERIKRYDGFLGELPCRHVRNEGEHVTISFWRDRDAIKAWRDDTEHARTRQLGREQCLAWYRIRVCELEREYAWNWQQ